MPGQSFLRSDMATVIIVEVEGDDSDPEGTAREAAKHLAVTFHTVVRSRLWEGPDTPSRAIKLAYAFDSLGNTATKEVPDARPV
jgi:hypothetical protein